MCVCVLSIDILGFLVAYFVLYSFLKYNLSHSRRPTNIKVQFQKIRIWETCLWHTNPFRPCYVCSYPCTVPINTAAATRAAGMRTLDTVRERLDLNRC